MITKEQQKDYLDSSGQICPYCGSKHIKTIGPIETDAAIAWQMVKCTSCEKEWRDLYQLIGCEDTD